MIQPLPSLREEALARLLAARHAIEAAGATAVGLFGSVARGDDGARSDIDVVAVCATSRDEDEARRAILEALRPLHRSLDVNFPSNLGLGSALWANCARDARMAFGVLPVAQPRKVPIPMDGVDGKRVIEAMVRRWPKLGPALEAQRTAVDDDIGRLARRLLANGLSSSDAPLFTRNYDVTALAELGRDHDLIAPSRPVPDPRKCHPDGTDCDVARRGLAHQEPEQANPTARR